MEELLPVLAVGGMLLIPITAILTTHQRKMAALIHGKPEGESVFNPRVDTSELVQEIRQLRAEVAALSIAVDDVRSESRALQQRTNRESSVVRN